MSDTWMGKKAQLQIHGALTIVPQIEISIRNQYLQLLLIWLDSIVVVMVSGNNKSQSTKVKNISLGIGLRVSWFRSAINKNKQTIKPQTHCYYLIYIAAILRKQTARNYVNNHLTWEIPQEWIKACHWTLKFVNTKPVCTTEHGDNNTQRMFMHDLTIFVYKRKTNRLYDKNLDLSGHFHYKRINSKPQSGEWAGSKYSSTKTWSNEITASKIFPKANSLRLQIHSSLQKVYTFQLLAPL